MEIAHMFNQTTESAEQSFFGHMSGGSTLFFGVMMILGWLTWFLVIFALIVLIRWLWKKGS